MIERFMRGVNGLKTAESKRERGNGRAVWRNSQKARVGEGCGGQQQIVQPHSHAVSRRDPRNRID